GARVAGADSVPPARALSGAKSGGNGRPRLPARAAFARLVGTLRITPATQVVAYDRQGGPYAARAWWLLRWLGHRAVAVLDGGFAAWERAGLPVSVRAVTRAARTFRAQADESAWVTSDAVAALVADGSLERGTQLLIDARSGD